MSHNRKYYYCFTLSFVNCIIFCIPKFQETSVSSVPISESLNNGKSNNKISNSSDSVSGTSSDKALVPNSESKSPSSDLYYSINDTPPWHLSLSLGFQVCFSTRTYKFLFLQQLINVVDFFPALLNSSRLISFSPIYPMSSNVHARRRRGASSNNFHNYARLWTCDSFAVHIWHKVLQSIFMLTSFLLWSKLTGHCAGFPEGFQSFRVDHFLL